ncbi:MAG: ABC transporter substrate-binding protein [Oscillospiraceae bacterium]|nr:ABC transporter substrate-binding protein [Oscillospiraceae bacterium]
MKKIISILVVALLTLSLFAGCSSKSGDSSDGAADSSGNTGVEKGTPEKTTFALGHLNSTAHLLAFVAAEEGFFEAEGLTVTVTQFASAGELVAGLEGGQLDAAFIGSVPTITNQAAGHDITIFGGVMTNGHGYVIKSNLVPEGFKEGDITVLKGRSVASVKNSIQDYELLVLLKNNNLEIGNGADKVNIVYFESQKDAYNALAGNEIDAVSVYSPYASVAEAAGHTVVYYCNEVEDFHDQPCCRQVALTSALAQNPNTYIAFERALIRAYKFTQENKAKTIDDVAKYITIEKSQIEYEVYGGHAKSVPDPDKHATEALKHGVVDFGYTDGKDYDFDALYNTSLYKTALEQLIAENPNDSIYTELKTHFDSAN